MIGVGPCKNFNNSPTFLWIGFVFYEKKLYNCKKMKKFYLFYLLFLKITLFIFEDIEI